MDKIRRFSENIRMRTLLVYVKPGSIRDEMICCGVVFIYEDGKSVFKWSKYKLDIATSLIKDKKKAENVKSLIETMFNNIERYKGDNIEQVIDHSRIHGTGLITYGKSSPIVMKNGEIDTYFSRFVENEEF